MIAAIICVTIGIITGIVVCVFAAIPDDNSFWD